MPIAERIRHTEELEFWENMVRSIMRGKASRGDLRLEVQSAVEAADLLLVERRKRLTD